MTISISDRILPFRSKTGGGFASLLVQLDAPVIVVDTQGADGVILQFTQLTPGADSYTIERSTNATSGFSSISTGEDGSDYTEAGLSDGITYYYRAKAVASGQDDSAYSAVVSVTIGVATFTPIIADDFTSYPLGSTEAGWRMPTVVDTSTITPPFGARCLNLKTNTGPTPPACGGSHYFGGRQTLANPIPIGNTIWMRMYFYFPSEFSMGYIFSVNDDAAANACDSEIPNEVNADGGNSGTKWMVFAPDSASTLRTYQKIGMTRRQIEQPAGGADYKIECEVDARVNGFDDDPLPRDQWIEMQMAMKVATDFTGWIRLWRDGVLKAELLNVRTINGNVGATTVRQWGLGDYWNGIPWTDGLPGREDFYMADVIVATDMPGYGAPTGTDANGNVFIDPATRAADLVPA